MSDNKPRDWDVNDLRESTSRLLYEGTGYPEDVSQLLSLFCEQIVQSPDVSEPLRDYVVGAFRAWLSGNARTLDQAFGLGRRGRPRLRATAQRNERIACTVALQMHEHGQTLEQAAADVAEWFKVHESDVKNVYADHRGLAIAAARFYELLNDDEKP